jgi:hypothetical protein
MRLARPRLPVCHEQTPMFVSKAFLDSFNDVVLHCGLKVDVVKLVVVRFFTNTGCQDLLSRYSITAILTIILLFVVVCWPDPDVNVKLFT